MTYAQDGETIFKKDCSTCHKLGAKLIGPDLQKVTERRSEDWFKKFVVNSQALIQSGDTDAQAIFDEFNGIPMPNNPHLTELDLQAIYSYLKGQATKTSVAATQSEPSPPPAPIEYSANDMSIGEALFTGKTSLSNGGTSCITCHHTNNQNVTVGGLLARDLTQVYSRLGDEAVQSIALTPPFPVMAEAYRKHPLKPEEARRIAAFLQKMDKEAGSQEVVTADFVFFKWGGGLFLVILVAVGLIWRNRKIHSVKSKIFNRQLKSV
ncbi:cytochrome c [Algoriphagus persicinus]|uniref:cytochrome c n=1 Tax=Algoriphagus persicinus TaxID=3108754 RepID=UPI002B3AE6AA|nr:cytochrome c [Algoriphagus sp. E1-3-M2]MEB2785323.1 cytochrome c [Algoriphagus sp. E1-3-M2]